MKRPVHQLLAASLAAHEPGCMFGVMGDANLFMVDSFIRREGGRYVAAAHEANAVLMALAYAQIADSVGVATITHGPGLTNAVTALVEGVKGSTPLVLLCGDTAPGDLQHLQKIRQREIVAATGAGFIELRSPDTAAVDLAVAFRRAAEERRPIVLNMPINLQWLETDQPPVVHRVASTGYATLTGAALDSALGLIAGAKAPIVLAGRGATSEAARSALVRLARTIEAPLATTLRAQGLFTGEPWNIGLFGSLSQSGSLDIIGQSDCLIVFGASLGKYTTSHVSLTRGKKIVQVMHRADQIGLHAAPEIGLVGDPALTAEAMADRLMEAEIAPSGFAHGDPPAQTGDIAADNDITAGKKGGLVAIDAAFAYLHRAIPADRTLVVDLGRFSSTAWLGLPVQSPRSLVHAVNFGAIGCGLSEAIGASFAQENRPTVLVAGDGGFLLSGLSEIATAVAHKRNLIIILCNDGCYGAEYVQFTARGMDPSLSMIHSLDFAPIAVAMGASAVTVRSPDDLERAGAAIADTSRPLIIDLKLDPGQVPNRL